MQHTKLYLAIRGLTRLLVVITVALALVFFPSAIDLLISGAH